MATENMDTDCMTLMRYILQEHINHPEATGDFTQLLTAISTAVKAVGMNVRKAGITELFGLHNTVNVQGEDVKKLDVLANELFMNMLKSSYKTCALVSEEEEYTVEVSSDLQGKYIVYFDPLDGSTNIDCLGSIGSIFSIAKRKTPQDSQLDLKQDVLQNGRNIVAAGYALYGSATVMVLSLGRGVHSFMLDPTLGEFILMESNMTIKPRGNIYSINEGYTKYWDDSIANYVRAKKFPKDGKSKPYGARYIGSMVADVHRTLVYGGIFMYPATKLSPNGKLRLLYECNPIAFLMEKAGGIAHSGEMPILDIQPTSLHQRCPIFMGSKDDVEEYLSYRN